MQKPRMSASARGQQALCTSRCDHDTPAPAAASVASSEPLAAPSPSASYWGPSDEALVKRRARHMSREERLRERFFGKLCKEQSPIAATERAGDTGAVATVGLSAISHPSSPSLPAAPRRDWGHGDSLYEPGDGILVERRAGHRTLSKRRAGMSDRMTRSQALADACTGDDRVGPPSVRSLSARDAAPASVGSTASSIHRTSSTASGALASFGSTVSVGSLNFFHGGHHRAQKSSPGSSWESQGRLPDERGIVTALGHIPAQEAHGSAQEANRRSWVGPMLQGGGSRHGSRQHHEPYAREHRPAHSVPALLGNMPMASNFDDPKTLHHAESWTTAAHDGDAVESPSDSQGRREHRHHQAGEEECDDSDLTLGPGAPPGL